jgi:pimeloyl-ACP methyl ester carboxylesterase
MQEVSEAHSGSAEVSNGKLYYEVAGRGDTVVLIHGNVGDRRHWDHQFATLAKGYRVIRYDVRGFGLSSVPDQDRPYSDYEDLRELLDGLGVRHAHVVGWSMGSGVAIDFALAHPERALSLISVGPWVNGYKSASVSSMFADLGSVVAAVQKDGVGIGADAWMQTPFFAATICDEAAGIEFYEVAKDYSWWALLNSSPLQQLEPPAVERLGEIAVPMLIVTAEHDIPACLEISDLLEREVAGAAKTVLSGTGHLSHIEKPDDFNKQVQAFLDSVSNSDE